MKVNKEAMKRKKVADEDEVGNSMDDAMRNAAKQRPELPPKMPPLGGTQEQEDKRFQLRPEVETAGGYTQYLDVDFDDNLALEMLQSIEGAISCTCSESLEQVLRHQHRTPTFSSPPIHCEPSMNNQPIFLNPTNFLSLLSQQEHEFKGSKDEPFRSASPALETEEKSSEDKETTAKLSGTPPSSPSSSPTPFFTPTGSRARKRLAVYQSLRVEARRKISEQDRKRVEAGMIEQAVAKSLKETAVCQKRKYAQNTYQPKPRSSLKEPLHLDDKDNFSSPLSQEAASPGASEGSYEGTWLDELALEGLVYDGTAFAL